MDLTKYAYIDIETAGEVKHFIELSDSKKREWTRISDKSFEGESPEESWINHSALFAEFGIITCAVIGTFDGPDIRTINVLKDFELKNLMQLKSGRLPYCGWNVKGFDIPFLAKRFMHHRLECHYAIQTFGLKPWELSALDLMECWKFGGWGKNSSQTAAALCLGLEVEETLPGSECHREWWEGDRAKVIDHCEADVRLLMDIAETIAPLLGGA